MAVLGIYFWKANDHSRELEALIYSGDAARLDELLTKHPSLANANNVDRENKGWRPLHMAAYIGNTKVLKVLLDHHADMEAKDKRGLTPLLWSTFVGKPDAAATLLSNGADINARGRDGRTAMDQAKLSLNQPMIELLRERGAKE